jgi:hypothetical protein
MGAGQFVDGTSSHKTKFDFITCLAFCLAYLSLASSRRIRIVEGVENK